MFVTMVQEGSGGIFSFRGAEAYILNRLPLWRAYQYVNQFYLKKGIDVIPLSQSANSMML